MLSDFEDESALDSLDFQGVKNGRKVFFELDIDDGTDNLRDFAGSDDTSGFSGLSLGFFRSGGFFNSFSGRGSFGSGALGLLGEV